MEPTETTETAAAGRGTENARAGGAAEPTDPLAVWERDARLTGAGSGPRGMSGGESHQGYSGGGVPEPYAGGADASDVSLPYERGSAEHGDWGGAGEGAFGRYEPQPRASGGRLLRSRLDALRELVGLSRSRVDRRELAVAGQVLDEAAARSRHSLGHTVVALAGATGGGKSTLFNAIAGARLSPAGVRRPTTAEPLACAWTDHADGLLDRLGIAPHARCRPADPYDPSLRGLVLLDLPDHDSAAAGHRERVDRLLGLVDAVVWVVDPEKYADAVLHERYLRPLAGYAEVTFVVLNQVDRLPGEAADQVLDDLRRLLDEDGLALGEHGEPGAAVLSVSALTGRGIGELRETLGRFVGECGAAERRLGADVDRVTERLRPAYTTGGSAGLTEGARHGFEDRLADAAGAAAVGQAAERAWLREAGRACGLPWGRLRGAATRESGGALTAAPVTARPAVDEAVRILAEDAAHGLPAPWALAVREAARRGAKGLPEAMDEAVAAAVPRGRPARPTWWSVAATMQVGLLIMQLVAIGWLLSVVTGGFGGAWLLPALLLAAGALGGPLLSWGCSLAARGPARAYGDAVEWRLRDAASGCGRAWVLEPVAAELMRYREVREKYAVAAGA
ncbi:GTPase [Streptomyces palmae]|nr:GTPase [Streptomyces palmae]